MSRHYDLIRDAYTAVLFQMMEKGLTGPMNRGLALELTAEVASKMTSESLSPQDVEQAIEYVDA